MVTIARKSPVNDPRRSPVQFVKGIINKGRRTPTKELDNRSNPGIDIFCDESIAPQVKSVRTNNSRRNEQVAAPGSPSKRRSQRIERNRQRVIVENASTNKPKSRDRLPEYSNIPGASFIKTTRSPQTTPSRDQSRSPVIHVVETKSLSPRPAKSRHSTTKRAHERRKSQREGSPTSVMEKLWIAAVNRNSSRDLRMSNTIMLPIVFSPMARQHQLFSQPPKRRARSRPKTKRSE